MKQPIGGKKIRQKSSHSALLQSVEVESPLFPPGAPQVGKLDAIIVPASRRAPPSTTSSSCRPGSAHSWS